MNQRLRSLLEACTQDMREHNPPLSARFIEEYSVSKEEFDFLCDALASGAENVLAGRVVAQVSLGAVGR
jgi:hypothetical protein